MSTIKDDMKLLIWQLNRYTKNYDEGHPLVSDKDWDDLYFKLQKMEEETGIIYPDSPTQKISYTVVNNLKKVTHNHPMLSLDKTKSSDDIASFVKGYDWLGMFKMDGLTISLTYEHGKLVRAETRGNGVEGEDVTHNAFVIKSIPKTIPTKDIGDYLYDIADRVVIDGEIICTIPDFESFKEEYKNPRNFAAGSIRLLDATECAKRNLTFVAWDLIEGINENFFFWRLEKLDDWGFNTVPRVGDAETVEDAIEILNKMDAHNIYPIDGYVFKFESKKYGESLGRTDHHFKNAIAYKFYDEEYETTLKDIEWTMGRTGILTPVAIYDDIEIDGSICNRASLHNISIMNETLGIPYKGQPIKIYKANMIIPQISWARPLEIVNDKDKGYKIIDEPSHCPICNKETIIKDNNGVKTLWCGNPNCEGKLLNRIDHYLGKKGLDVKGISKATIGKLIDWGWINELRDIYKLDGYRTEWISKEGFGTTSVEKILNAINNSRSGVLLQNFISALGISLVGKTVAKTIAKEFSSWQEFRDYVDTDDCFFDVFEGIGEEIDNSIKNFDYSEADKIAEMLTFKQPDSSSDDESTKTAENLIFCITGKVNNWKNRDELKSYIESIGGKVTGSVTSKTNYLINNDSTSTSAKNVTAKKNGVPIITEAEFIEAFGQKN